MGHLQNSDIPKVEALLPQGSETQEQLWEISKVLSACDLKSKYLMGIKVFDAEGCEVEDEWFDFHIANAISWIETELNVKVAPIRVTSEQHDYLRADYTTYGFLRLNQYPMIQVTRFRAVYPTSNEEFDLPLEWLKTMPISGQFHIIPTSGTISQVILGSGGTYLPLVYDNINYLPNLWHVDYIAGFANGKMPHDIRDLIMKQAAIQALHIAGERIGGFGVASSSINVDNISQSTTTTKSQGNAFFYRIDRYQKELDEKLPRLQAYWKGIKFTTV